MSIKLIDLSSNNQPPYDLAAAKADDVDGVIVKITEGAGYENPYFDETWAEAKKAGLWRAAYCFAQPSQTSPQQQADFLLSKLTDFETYDDLVVDMEVPDPSLNLSIWALEYADEISKRFKSIKQILYASLSFVESYLQDPRLAEVYRLWLADYGVDTIPSSIPPWTNGATLWQYTDSGTVKGINGPVDLTTAEMTLAELRALGKPAPVVVPPPTPQPPAVHYPHGARVRSSCELKDDPSHYPPSKGIAAIPGPPGGLIIDTGRRQKVVADVWALVQFRDLMGWILADNIELT